MATPPYPLIPGPMKRGWFDRHPAWKIPIGCFMLILLVGTYVAGIVELSFRHSEVFALAMAKAGENMQVRSEIGAPLKAGWRISGNLRVAGLSGYANLSIPIAGSRHKGVIHVVAAKCAGTWQFKQLVVNVEEQTEAIDLLATEPKPKPEF
jgi:hypothetical protein